MMSRHLRHFVGSLCACSMLCGCADAFKAPYPAKAYFLIDPGHPDIDHTNAPGKAIPTALDDSPLPKRANGDLKIRQFQVAEPYDGSAFVYKVGPNQYESDYYSAFFLTTGKMLSADARDWLNRSHLFAHVVDTSSGVRTPYLLDGNVSGFYADYTNRQKPVAVLEAQFFLLAEEDAGPAIVFARSYSTSAPITGRSPASAVDAWNQACRTLLEELTADLARNIAIEGTQSNARDSGAPGPG